jgi:YD repeat-containing protein
LDGNQATKTDHPGKVAAYTYDGLDRLTSETVTGEGAVSYAYDDSNNRVNMTVTGGANTSYIYDKNNRLLTETTVSKPPIPPDSTAA